MLDQSLNLAEDRLSDKVVLYLSIFLFTINIGMVFVHVLLRQVPTIKYSLIPPVARYVMIVAVFFGAAVASRNQQHISISYVPEKLRERSKRAWLAGFVFRKTVTLLFLLIAVLAMFQAAVSNLGVSFGDTNLVTPFQVYTGIFLGFLVMLLYELEGAITRIKSELRSTTS